MKSYFLKSSGGLLRQAALCFAAGLAVSDLGLLLHLHTEGWLCETRKMVGGKGKCGDFSLYPEL